MAFGDSKGTLSITAGSITNPFTATGSVSVSIGDLIICGMSQQTQLTVTTVSDNLGNTYTALNAGTDAGNVTGRAYYSYVTVAGTLTSVSAVTSASTTDAAWGCVVIEGPFNATPLDANPANISNDLTSPYTCPATGTLAQSDELIAAFAMSNGGTDDWVSTAPNTQRLKIAPSVSAKLQIGTQVVAATTSVAPEFTGSAPNVDVLITASFKKSAGAAFDVKPTMFLVF